MTSPKRVLMMVYGFIPDDPRVITEARTVTQLGYEVMAIGAGFPNGCSGNYSRDDISISIVPVVNKVSHIPAGLWNLIRGHIPEQNTPAPLTPASNVISLSFFFLWILRLTLFKKLDLIHAHEHQTMPIGWLLAKLKRIAWIYDAHEHVPGNREIFQTLKARLAVSTEAFFLRRADTVITVGKRLQKNLQARGADNVIIIGNWKQLGRFQVDPDIITEKRQIHNLDRFAMTVVYIGVVNEERQTDMLLAAIRHTPEIGLLIAGKGELRDLVIEAAKTHDNIIWLDWLPYDEVPVYTLMGNIIYACLKEVSGNPEYMAPNKLFDAFAAGKAMIARRGLGEIGQILEDEEAAILLDEVTPATVQAALEQLRDDPELLQQLQANASAAGQKYNWSTAEKRLETLYNDLTQPKS